MELNFYESKQVVACGSQNYKGLYRTCFCCRNTNIPLIKLSSCSHNGFLMFYFMTKINLAKTVVCQYCHAILRKIQKFKKQVEQSIINSEQANSKIIRTLLKMDTVSISIDPEDVTPIEDNSIIFLPETIIEDDSYVKEEFVFDKSKKPDSDDFSEEENPLGYNIERKIPVWRLDTAEMQNKKLHEEQLEPNINPFEDHNYARSNIKDEASFTKLELEKTTSLNDKASSTKSVFQKATSIKDKASFTESTLEKATSIKDKASFTESTLEKATSIKDKASFTESTLEKATSIKDKASFTESTLEKATSIKDKASFTESTLEKATSIKDKASFTESTLEKATSIKDKASFTESTLEKATSIKDKASSTEPALQKATNKKDKALITKSAFEKATKIVRVIEMEIQTETPTNSILIKENQRQPTEKTRSVYQCEICFAVFYEKTTHEDHMKAHEKMPNGRLDLVGKIDILHLNREEMEIEREKRRHNQYAKFEYKCEDCLTSFLFEDGLQTHMKKHDLSKSEYVCEVCKCVYSSEWGLTKHEEYHWKRYQCVECGEKFVHDVKCISHYNEKHGKEGAWIGDFYLCRYEGCDYVANDANSHSRHVRRTHTQRLNCDICGNLYKSAATLKSHLQTFHAPRRMYECKQCDKKFKCRGSVVLHMRAHHTKNKEVAYCKECDKMFKDQNRLNVHLKTHSRHITEEQKKFICDICGKRFLDKVRIRSHIEITHLRAAFQCAHCDKLLSCSRALRKHELKQHSGRSRPPPEPTLCQICGRGYKHAMALKDHLKSHSEDRPLKCTRCPATFSRKASLYTHNRLVHKVPKKPKPEIHTYIVANAIGS